MRYLILALLLTGCVTIADKPKDPICRGTKMIGWAKPSDMNKLDIFNYQTAKAECPKRYNGRSPCLVKFERTGKYSYYAICGQLKGE